MREQERCPEMALLPDFHPVAAWLQATFNIYLWRPSKCLLGIYDGNFRRSIPSLQPHVVIPHMIQYMRLISFTQMPGNLRYHVGLTVLYADRCWLVSAIPFLSNEITSPPEQLLLYIQ